MVEKLERPKLPSPVTVGGNGKIVVKISGRLAQVATQANVKVERIE